MDDVPGTHEQGPLAEGRIAEGTRKARRRLLLGAAAAMPSVLTLTSGAAAAAGSVRACRDRLPSANVERFTAVKDAWLRAPVYTGTLGTQPAYCVMPDQGDCISPLDRSTARPGSIWIVNGNRVTAGVDNAAITNVSGSPQAYGLVYVDEHGTVAKVDQNYDNSLQPAATSCWTSMVSGRAGLG